MADKTISLTAATPTPIDRTDLLARLRVELHDEDSSNYRWTSATLHRHIERAVREVSQAWSRERLTVLTSVANSRDIDVSSNFDDLVRIDAIEWPIDTKTAYRDWQPAEASPIVAYQIKRREEAEARRRSAPD